MRGSRINRVTRSRPHLTHRRVVGAASLAVVVALSIAGCSASGSAAPTSSASAATASFYKGKTVTFIVGNAPGSTPANAMVALKPVLEEKLGATINMSFSAANPIVSEDQVGTAAADGLTMGELSLGSALVAQIAGTGTPQFSLPNASFVGATVQQDDLVVACTGSPFKTMDQVITNKTPVKMVSQKNTNNGLIAAYVLGAYPVDHSWNYYSGSADQNAGCVRGDGNLSVGNVSSFTNAAGTAMTPGFTPLLLMSKEPTSLQGAFLNSEVPTLAEFTKKHPPKTAASKEAVALMTSVFTPTTPSFAIFGPPKVPTARIAEFTAAMKAAVNDPTVKKAFEAQSQPPGFVAPTDVKAFVQSTLKDSAKIKPYLSGN